jgi:gamma-glutamyl phosphate reductase
MDMTDSQEQEPLRELREDERSRCDSGMKHNAALLANREAILAANSRDMVRATTTSHSGHTEPERAEAPRPEPRR